ncbi:MAG TPA: hypothetical protein H9819_03655, partial [Candidatus Bacteroides merdipullorum]|nr:hypothetical protein [Candidatus Bacteroides merdipullorum]
WCNGSTTDFGSVCPSSNLGSPTHTNCLLDGRDKLKGLSLLFLFLFHHSAFYFSLFSLPLTEMSAMCIRFPSIEPGSCRKLH